MRTLAQIVLICNTVMWLLLAGIALAGDGIMHMAFFSCLLFGGASLAAAVGLGTQ